MNICKKDNVLFILNIFLKVFIDVYQQFCFSSVKIKLLHFIKCRKVILATDQIKTPLWSTTNPNASFPQVNQIVYICRTISIFHPF